MELLAVRIYGLTGMHSSLQEQSGQRSVMAMYTRQQVEGRSSGDTGFYIIFDMFLAFFMHSHRSPFLDSSWGKLGTP